MHEFPKQEKQVDLSNWVIPETENGQRGGLLDWNSDGIMEGFTQFGMPKATKGRRRGASAMVW